jgi:chemotaxis protein methyltransferase CheR
MFSEREKGSGVTAVFEQPRRLLSEREFARFQTLIHAEAGIFLSPVKQALVVSRLAKRLRALDMHSFSDYYDLVVNDAAEKVMMLDCICTNETHFFRERRHFQYLEQNVLPGWRAEAARGKRPRRMQIWSAGCSTGEEPYSLAMFLLDQLADEDWTIEIVATDLSTKVLKRAVAGLWPIAKVAEIPERLLKQFMLCGTGANEGLMKAGPEITSLIRFERLNLNHEAYPVSGPFDLTFCCNVMIYFNAETKRQVLGRMIDKLSPAGYLMLGHAETLNGLGTELRPVAPTVYTAGRLEQRSRDLTGTQQSRPVSQFSRKCESFA